MSPEITESYAFGGTYTSEIISQWRILSIVFVLLSIGLIALCYPVANAFNFPELRAWADVELSEAFTTVLIVIFVIAILIFVELVTQGILLTTDEFECDEGTYCPVSVAENYVQDYLDKSLAVFDDLMADSVMSGKYATMSVSAGTNYFWLLYLSISFKIMPNFMIDVTTLGQQMQFLMGMRDALLFQQFLLKHVSGVLAPAALLLGIIFRSFFVTRKLGGLLIAFGVGFMLIFPVTYALSFFTMQTTLYGSSSTGGELSNEYCTISCRQLPPLAYNSSSGAPYSHSQIMALFPQSIHQNDEDYAMAISDFIAGEHCESHEREIWSNEDGEECDEGDEGCLNLQNETYEVCTDVPTTKYSSVAEEDVISCGVVTYEDCPLSCRSLPYPNTNPECASRYTEYMCREVLTEHCFITRYADMNDPALGGMLDQDSGAGDACPLECRPLAGLKKEGCDIGYGFKYYGEDMEVSSINNQMDDMDYGETVWDRCAEKWDSLIADWFCDEDHNAAWTLHWLGYEDLKEDSTVAWEEACPNSCRWITTEGRMGTGCENFCNKMVAVPDGNPAPLWNAAYEAALSEDDPEDLMETQMLIAEQSCYMIVPEEALSDPDCTTCSYLLDPGFASYPPVHQRCDNLCGKTKMVGVSKEGDNSAIDGFDGPAQTKAITKLVVPAIILPLLNLVITFMFIRTLSPLLGGEVDIPGMSGLIK